LPLTSGNPKIELAADGVRWTLTLPISMRRWQFIFIAVLVALLFGGGSKAMTVAPNRWTPEKGNPAYTHDGVGNLTSILYPQSSILCAYDGLNRLTNMVDAAGNHGFAWTPASQLASEWDAWATNFYGYSQGLRIGLTNVEPGGNWVQTYSYDDGWRLQAILSPAGDFGYGYNPGSASPLVTGIALPNGANIVNSYDSLARLRQTSLNNYWGHALDSYTYTPDPLGLRTNIVKGSVFIFCILQD
jgi:YD repeat-containing protein